MDSRWDKLGLPSSTQHKRLEVLDPDLRPAWSPLIYACSSVETRLTMEIRSERGTLLGQLELSGVMEFEERGKKYHRAHGVRIMEAK